MLYYFITPFLGLIRNYVKYKQFNLNLFIRTPLIYYIIQLIFQENTIFETLIYERWFFLIYKTILSIYKDDYHMKKEKYKIKYNIEY